MPAGKLSTHAQFCRRQRCCTHDRSAKLNFSNDGVKKSILVAQRKADCSLILLICHYQVGALNFGKQTGQRCLLRCLQSQEFHLYDVQATLLLSFILNNTSVLKTYSILRLCI